MTNILCERVFGALLRLHNRRNITLNKKKEKLRLKPVYKKPPKILARQGASSNHKQARQPGSQGY